MPNNSRASTSDMTWWAQEDINLAETESRRMSFLSNYTVKSDSVVTLPVTGNATPMTPLTPMPGWSSPELRTKIQNASPDTARQFALRMYDSLKRHGLRREVGRVLAREDGQIEEIKDGEDGIGMENDELLGMEYLLKDGFVSYLRDMAKITPPIPQQVVRFSGVKYSRKSETSSDGYETFGNKLAGCFIGPVRTVLKEKSSSHWVNILDGVDGYIMPGSTILLIGPPGSGKSTLLEIIAGRAPVNKNSSVEGSVLYNDRLATDIRLSRLIAYINGQLNKHIPFLTVRETLEFARDCTQGLRPENFTPQMRKFFAHALVEGQDPFLEYMLAILGLKEVEHKLTGDGISDTDCQKLMTAELALGTFSLMLYDQPLVGTDLAATHDLVDTIRTISRIQQSSAIMSLTQLSQEIFDLFDRVILLSGGQILFQGPRQDAIPYFTRLGYMKPPNVESHEFLEDVAAGDGADYMVPGATALTVEELVECYKASDHFQDVSRIVGGDHVKHTYWVESELGLGLTLKTPSKYLNAIDALPRRETELVVAKLSSKVGHSGGIQSTGRVQVGDVVTGISINNEEMQYLAVGAKKIQRERATQVFSMLKQARGHIRLQVERITEEEEEEDQTQWKQFQRPFVQTWFGSTRTLIKRQIKITKRLQALIKLRLFQATILGLFGGTLFFMLGGKCDQQKMNSVRALGFVSTMSIMLINLVQLPLYMLQRPIFYKHRAQRFFRASSYVVAHCIVNVPQTVVEAFAYTISVYFLAGLSSERNGTPFFQYLLLLVMVAYFGSSVFFFLGAVSSIPEVGNALAGLLVSIFLLFSGFVIYPSNVPTSLKWLIYVNPIHWANVSFCKIQFENYRDSCSKYESELPFCSQYPHMTVGKAYLTFFELSEDAESPWLPYVILAAWILLANSLALLGLKTIQFAGVSQSLPSSTASPVISKYREDTDIEYNSLQSLSSHARHLRSASYSGQQCYGMMKDTGGVERWIQEFRVELEKSELGIPVKPFSIVFEDLSFTRYTKDPEENAPVFRDIAGYARPKDMLALLGGSKMIKSTLLKCLAGRVPLAGNLDGNLQANGIEVGSLYARRVGYVEKLDAHQPYLTVRETLQFSAALRLAQSITAENRCIHVELVLDQLDLLPYSNQLVGSLRDATGKTFEIAKKITIAVELAANPSVLLLEEPLAGLDSRGTHVILGILSKVSESGRVIIASLEYPNTRVLESFDLALVLTHDGQQAYFGSVGPDCNELLDYFLSIPKAPRYSKRAGPVSFVLATLGLGVKKRTIPMLDFSEIYKASALQETNSGEISRIKILLSDTSFAESSSVYSAPYSLQAALVLMRTQRLLWRNVQYTYGRLTGCIMIGLLMGSLYYKIEYTDIYGLTSRSLYIYMQVILIGVISANNIIPQIGTDRLVYFREKRAGMYLPIFYPISWAVGEIPYFFVATLAVVGIGNGMAGIGTGSAHEFLTYWMVLFVFTLCVTYFGMMITFLAPVPTLAAFAVSILTSLWVSASGVVVILSDIRFYKWMYWSNPFQYAVTLLTSISFYCDSSEAGNRCPRLADGSYVWERLSAVRSLNYDRRGADNAILSSMCLLFACLAFLFFVVLKHNSPPRI